MLQHYRRTLIAATIVLSCILAAALGWEIYDGYADRSGWETRNGSTYYTDFYGDAATGWQEIDGQVYYFGLNRAMHTGWLTAGEDRYFFADDGHMHTGWLDTDDGRYYFSADGKLYTGWLDTEEGSFLLREDGRMHTGWIERDGQRRYIAQDGKPHTGWLEDGGNRYYLKQDGTPHTGWLEDGEQHFYFSDDGTLYTGWLQQGEYRYYFLEDGTMATGPVQIDGRTYYFTPKGIHVILVNRDNPVPEDYVLNLVEYLPYFDVDVACLDALTKMLADCKAAGNLCSMNSAYRSVQQQWGILNSRTAEYMADGLSYDAALAKTLLSVAVPGTSEHHLGLAVDIDGMDALEWLNEHCWEYGFILRYLEGKTHITGIIHEPWHFRYVGTEVSMDMKDTGLCLEEYLGAYPPESADE